jgi:hypothetical protein
MRAALVRIYKLRRLETADMTINGKDIYTAPDGHIYSFSGFGGLMNCTRCDNDTMVNEYNNEDGAVVWFCKPCEDLLHL